MLTCREKETCPRIFITPQPLSLQHHKLLEAIMDQRYYRTWELIGVVALPKWGLWCALYPRVSLRCLVPALEQGGRPAGE